MEIKVMKEVFNPELKGRALYIEFNTDYYEFSPKPEDGYYLVVGVEYARLIVKSTQNIIDNTRVVITSMDAIDVFEVLEPKKNN